MKKYKESLESFAKSIFGGNSASALPFVSSRPRTSKEKAMNVYIDGYTMRLSATVGMNYPALRHYLGSDKFDKWIQKFVSEVKSESYNLDFYPLKFDEFFRARNQTDKFASELCHLECEIQKVFFLPDPEPLTMVDIATIPPEALGDLILKERMASIALCFKHNTHEYLTAFRDGNPIEVKKQRECVFVYRHDNLVQRKVLSELEFDILSDVKSGKHLHLTFEKMEEKFTLDDILKGFQTCVNSGFFRK